MFKKTPGKGARITRFVEIPRVCVRVPAPSLFERFKRCALTLSLVLFACCGGTKPRTYGEQVDPASSVPLSSILSSGDETPSQMVVVSGRIGEVCRSAGCWFVLQDTAEGKYVEVLVDLKKGASFTVPASIQGRKAYVKGRFEADKSNLQLNAVGLRLE